MSDCESCKYLGDKTYLIGETKYWKIDLSEKQRYLGRCYVTLKRHCGDLAELKKEELLDFLEVVRNLESALKKAFGATMFNWTCLMNNAYQAKIPQPHVHWHFKPRYDKKVKFAGLLFEDLEFGQHYSREEIKVSENARKKIIEQIKKYL